VSINSLGRADRNISPFVLLHLCLLDEVLFYFKRCYHTRNRYTNPVVVYQVTSPALSNCFRLFAHEYLEEDFYVWLEQYWRRNIIKQLWYLPDILPCYSLHIYGNDIGITGRTCRLPTSKAASCRAYKLRPNHKLRLVHSDTPVDRYSILYMYVGNGCLWLCNSHLIWR
jgi:hypothetical protein